jgi:hypothetical protein
MSSYPLKLAYHLSSHSVLLGRGSANASSGRVRLCDFPRFSPFGPPRRAEGSVGVLIRPVWHRLTFDKTHPNGRNSEVAESPDFRGSSRENAGSVAGR